MLLGFNFEVESLSTKSLRILRGNWFTLSAFANVLENILVKMDLTSSLINHNINFKHNQ